MGKKAKEGLIRMSGVKIVKGEMEGKKGQEQAREIGKREEYYTHSLYTM